MSFLSALTFGLGLGVSGMTSPARVLGFLDFTGKAGWDPTLAAVLGSGVLVTMSSFHFLSASECPVYLDNEQKVCSSIKMGTDPANMKFSWDLVLGSSMFGAGWGMSGLCPGPAITSFGAGIAPFGVFVPSMLAGMVLKYLVKG